jgi:ubiquinone/menaquinone biosynthesis C-methylase UbiE
VLDVGCGCGADVFVASQMVTAQGRAAGLDLTPEMLAHARAAAGRWSPRNVAFEAGDVESMPFADDSFDAVISNGALNLAPDKEAAFREIARVLRPGGRLAVADLLVVDSVPESLLASMDAWST